MGKKKQEGGHGIQAFRCGDVTDWNGRVLRKEVFRILAVGDTVRVAVRDGDSHVAPYFQITAMKDGTFWGRAMDTYGTLSMCLTNLKEGQIFPFRSTSIIEIPILWQRKSQQRKMEPYLTYKRYSITGLR